MRLLARLGPLARAAQGQGHVHLCLGGVGVLVAQGLAREGQQLLRGGQRLAVAQQQAIHHANAAQRAEGVGRGGAQGLLAAFVQLLVLGQRVGVAAQLGQGHGHAVAKAQRLRVTRAPQLF